MNCPQCYSSDISKNGKVKEKQRFICKDCNYQFTQLDFENANQTKRHALELYLEGLSLREISNYLPVSHVAIFNWLKNFNPMLDEIRSTNKPTINSIKNASNLRLINSSSNLLLINLNTDKSYLVSEPMQLSLPT